MSDALSQLRNRAFAFGLVVFALMAAVAAYGWFSTEAGAELPVHWSSSGEVNRYGSRFEAFALMPLIWLAMVVVFALLPAMEPRRRHLAQSRLPYLMVMLATGLSMLVIHALTTAAALGATVDIARVIPPIVGALLVVTGNYMGKTRSNYFIGVRTPWTLSSELSWRKTHRWAGRVFVLIGLVMVVGAVLPWPQTLMLASVGVLMIASLALVAYSYVVWRTDPARE
ncbi:MAG: SdpI family protein [Pseudomonadota bacterium]